MSLDQARANFNKNAQHFEYALKSAGIYVRCTCSLRSNAEQAATYAKGRTKPGKIVTNAKPGESPHNYALAKDYVIFTDSTKKTCLWNTADRRWKTFGRLAKECGLTWGGTFSTIKDYAHVEHPTWRNYKTVK